MHFAFPSWPSGSQSRPAVACPRGLYTAGETTVARYARMLAIWGLPLDDYPL